MVVEVSSKTKEAMLDVMKLYGYRSAKEFIEDALRRRILDLKRKEFLGKTEAIKKKVSQKGLTEEAILRDFDEFYHKQ